MRELTIEETARVEGGVIAGPNGEGCTDPRTGDGKATYALPGSLTFD